MTTKRAAIYLRISLDSAGDGLAVDRQRQDCESIAKTRGWAVTETYTDNSVSASKRTVRRPEYDRMVVDFQAGEFDALICYDLDRLTRQPRQLEDWIDAAEVRGLLLVTANGEADLTTDGGRMYARIKASVARAEVERKSARQIRAAQQRADLGNVPKGPRLNGYETDGTIVPAEAEQVREMFTSFSAGNSLYSIAADLERRGVASRRGDKWRPSSIRTTLTNPRYAGRASYKGVTTGKAGQWLPIVDEAIFDSVQAILNDPRRIRNRIGTDRKHLGAGLFLCGVCGKKVQTNGTRYWCRVGGHITRSMAPIDEMVNTLVRARIASPDFGSLLVQPDDVRGKLLDDEAAILRARLATIENDYDVGVIDGRRYAVASEKVRAELAVTESARVRSAAGVTLDLIAKASDRPGAFDAAPLGVQRVLIDALMSVTLLPVKQGIKGFNPDTVTIDWRRPQ
jgi:site-specific DNA recombinase